MKCFFSFGVADSVGLNAECFHIVWFDALKKKKELSCHKPQSLLQVIRFISFQLKTCSPTRLHNTSAFAALQRDKTAQQTCLKFLKTFYISRICVPHPPAGGWSSGCLYYFVSSLIMKYFVSSPASLRSSELESYYEMCFFIWSSRLRRLKCRMLPYRLVRCAQKKEREEGGPSSLDLYEFQRELLHQDHLL